MRRPIIARLRFHVPVTALLLAAPAAAADPPVSLAVRPSVVFAGADVRTTVRTPPDARNRELRISIDAPDYYASSDVQLDGDGAAATHQFTWKALPGGAYRVEAILLREDGKTETVSTCFAVLVGDDGSLGIASRRRPVPQAQAAAPGSC
ncbi:MAG TPA: hypothetical protein VNR90_03665 [Vicinamibacterales bacterium]|nr:hypothetical protein [Vicinamibacterales bacterium]